MVRGMQAPPTLPRSTCFHRIDTGKSQRSCSSTSHIQSHHINFCKCGKCPQATSPESQIVFAFGYQLSNWTTPLSRKINRLIQQWSWYNHFTHKLYSKISTRWEECASVCSTFLISINNHDGIESKIIGLASCFRPVIKKHAYFTLWLTISQSRFSSLFLSRKTWFE